MRHTFRYFVRLMYLDLSELEKVFSRSWFAGQHWLAPLRFQRGDYLGNPQHTLLSSVRDLLRERGRPQPDGKICLLTQVRTFGFVFNPVSFYLTFDCQGQMGDVVAEVHNTPWNERYAYVVTPQDYGPAWPRSFLPKQFHVSPFLPMDLEYRWRISEPRETLRIQIACYRCHQRQFTALLDLRRRSLSHSALARMVFFSPWATYATLARIYWQALRLWWKRVPFVPHPNSAATSKRRSLASGSDGGQASMASADVSWPRATSREVPHAGPF